LAAEMVRWDPQGAQRALTSYATRCVAEPTCLCASDVAIVTAPTQPAILDALVSRVAPSAANVLVTTRVGQLTEPVSRPSVTGTFASIVENAQRAGPIVNALYELRVMDDEQLRASLRSALSNRDDAAVLCPGPDGNGYLLLVDANEFRGPYDGPVAGPVTQ